MSRIFITNLSTSVEDLDSFCRSWDQPFRGWISSFNPQLSQDNLGFFLYNDRGRSI
jgi:hypothetical protein